MRDGEDVGVVAVDVQAVARLVLGGFIGSWLVGDQLAG